MTSLLKNQLTVLGVAAVLGGALLWNSGSLRAQDIVRYEAANSASENADDIDPQRPKMTADEAAKRFSSVMDSINQSDNYSLTFRETLELMSLRTQKQLGDQTRTLFEAMARQWKQPDQKVRVLSEDLKMRTVVVENEAAPAPRPLVLIEENGGWSVDLVETYARWNHLEGAAKAEAIFRITGAILPEMPQNEAFQRSRCQTNLKKIALGLLQYTQDYDEKMPPAKSWIDVLQPYVKSEAIFNCPSLPQGKRYGYAFNSRLSGKPLAILANISEITAIYETSVLQRNAYGMGENLAFRHQNGANYAFADGHVKWFSKSVTPSFNIGRIHNLPTFNALTPFDAPPPMAPSGVPAG